MSEGAEGAESHAAHRRTSNDATSPAAPHPQLLEPLVAPDITRVSQAVHQISLAASAFFSAFFYVLMS